jgi:hypothetical protein
MTLYYTMVIEDTTVSYLYLFQEFITNRKLFVFYFKTLHFSICVQRIPVSILFYVIECNLLFLVLHRLLVKYWQICY